MILPLHLLLDAPKQPFQLLLLPIHLLRALLPQVAQLGIQLRHLLSRAFKVMREGMVVYEQGRLGGLHGGKLFIHL
jgi:hypothetical protein